jgi:hypothetical protein
MKTWILCFLFMLAARTVLAQPSVEAGSSASEKNSAGESTEAVLPVDLLQALQPSMVTVTRGDRAGAGIVFENPRQVVTSLSVVDSRGRIKVRTLLGLDSSARIVAVDRKHELVLLELEQPVAAVPWPKERFATGSPVPGQNVLVVIRPVGQRSTAFGPIRSSPGIMFSFARVTRVDSSLAPPTARFESASGLAATAEQPRFWLEGSVSIDAGSPVLTSDGKLLGLSGRGDDLPYGLARAAFVQDLLALPMQRGNAEHFRPRSPQATATRLGMAAGSRGLGFDVRTSYRRHRLLAGAHVLGVWRRAMPIRTDTFQDRMRFTAAATLGTQWQLPDGSMSLSVGPAVVSQTLDTTRVGATRDDKVTSAKSEVMFRPLADLVLNSGWFYFGFSLEVWSHPAAYFSIGLGSESPRW